MSLLDSRGRTGAVEAISKCFEQANVHTETKQLLRVLGSMLVSSKIASTPRTQSQLLSRNDVVVNKYLKQRPD